MIKRTRPNGVPADPQQWSKESKQSVAFSLRREYVDISYHCRHCNALSVWTAQEQKDRFEVKKAYIFEHRTLCAACWVDSHRIHASLLECDEKWSVSKPTLRTDKLFLSRWLEQLLALEKYRSHKPDTAKKKMLSKLIGDA